MLRSLPAVSSLALLVAGSASAAIWTVGPQSSANFFTLRDAVDSVMVLDGDTIAVSAAGYIGDFDTGSKVLSFTQAPALGIVDVLGNMQVRSNSNLTFQVGGYNSGLVSGDPEFDQYIVTGNVNYAGKLTVQLINGLSPHLGDSWALIQAGGTINFSGTSAMPALGGGLSWNVAVVSGSSEFGSTGSSLVISVVPAPGAFALIGLAGMVANRRRRA
jgi:hypothetical protein